MEVFVFRVVFRAQHVCTVRLHFKVDTQVPTLWLCARALISAPVTHVTTEAGLAPLLQSHSV